MAQFTMEDIARIGLLKMDFLGLANLTILSKVQEIIYQNRGIEIDLSHIPMDDAKTFDLLSSGETAGVFQLEGAGMRRYIKELKPTTFSDIAAMVALYRPGPMEHIPTFIKAKHGEESIRYPHPALAGILEETYGVIVYQDQVLFIVQALAGYSLGQADVFRKAMSKKIPEVMQKEKLNFIAGAREKEFSAEVAAEVFALIEPFAGYAFNKAHSVSYALIAYQTAYLKANYPAEYITAFLITNADQPEKVASAVAECRRLGITVLPPDINHSQVTFSIEKNDDSTPAISFGLAAIKNVGLGAMETVIAERNKGGEFKSIEDLCRRSDLRGVNKRVMESLIKAGALDSLGNRGTLLHNINSILSLAQREQRLRETGQSTMFDLWGETMPPPMPSLDLETAGISMKEKLTWERELMGVYLSEHPFSSFDSRSAPENTILCGQVDVEMVGKTVLVAGMVASVSHLFTKDRRPFVSAVLEDLNGRVEVMAWTQVYESTRELWQEGNILLVEGKVRLRDDRVQLNCNSVSQYQAEIAIPAPDEVPPVAEVTPPETASPVTPPPATASPVTPPPQAHRLVLSITQSDNKDDDIASLQKLIGLLKDFPGQDEVTLSVGSGDSVENLRLSNASYCPELHRRLVELVGENGLRVESLVS